MIYYHLLRIFPFYSKKTIDFTNERIIKRLLTIFLNEILT